MASSPLGIQEYYWSKLLLTGHALIEPFGSGRSTLWQIAQETPFSDNSRCLHAFVVTCAIKFALSHLKNQEFLKGGSCYVPFPSNQETTNFSRTLQLADTVKGLAAARRHCHRGRVSLLRRRLRAAHLQQGRR